VIERNAKGEPVWVNHRFLSRDSVSKDIRAVVNLVAKSAPPSSLGAQSSRLPEMAVIDRDLATAPLEHEIALDTAIDPVESLSFGLTSNQRGQWTLTSSDQAAAKTHWGKYWYADPIPRRLTIGGQDTLVNVAPIFSRWGGLSTSKTVASGGYALFDRQGALIAYLPIGPELSLHPSTTWIDWIRYQRIAGKKEPRKENFLGNSREDVVFTPTQASPTEKASLFARFRRITPLVKREIPPDESDVP
jgi:hypothetical protein